MSLSHSSIFISLLKNKPVEYGNQSFLRDDFSQSVQITNFSTYIGINSSGRGNKFPDIIFNQGDVFEKDIIFDGGNFSKIIFRGGTFKGNLIFRNGTYNGFVSIRGGSFEKKLVFLGGEFKHWVGTLDGKGNKDNPIDKHELAEEELKINSLEIEGGSVANNFWISGGTINNLEIKSVTPARIHIKPPDDLIELPDGKIARKFKSFPDIHTLSFLRYFHKDSFVQVSDITIQELKFEEFTNLGNISFNDLEVDQNKDIIIRNADLGRTSFIDCDLSCSKLKFRSSKLSEITVIGTNFPYRIITFEDSPTRPNTLHSKAHRPAQEKLVLSQLKKVYENRGDLVEAGKYHARELNVHIQTLPFGWEKFNLLLNKWTNNHGQDWRRASLVLLGMLAVMLTVYCFILGVRPDLSFSNSAFNEFFRLAGLSFEYLNPIRKSDFLPKIILDTKEDPPIRSIIILWDSLSKIVFAYLIYQLIAAFRKHGRTK